VLSAQLLDDKEAIVAGLTASNDARNTKIDLLVRFHRSLALPCAC
jgi:hypothetical protein